ncbi:MAG: Holliday junction branch migration protein RuvA [Chloroflexi bacterium]|nr:Holliday junction branch migration protein RuvA [Chloroflexota bacterium]
MSSLISSVSGQLEGTGADWMDVAIGGITLRIGAPLPCIEAIGQVGGPVRLFTSLQVREDNLSLYGFDTPEARQTFETLIGISGIGPRVALNILSIFRPDALAAAVESGDVKSFTAVPGVGRKTASRIVLELKGKLELDWSDSSVPALDSDAIEALTALGYTPLEAREALSALSENGSDLTTEDQVRMALQKLAG